MRRTPRFCGTWLLLLAVVWGLVGCGAASGDPGPTNGGSEQRTLTVSAASSLTDAFGELAVIFEKKNPGVEVRTTFAGSSIVLNQILQGAPADVFASADQAKMEVAIKEDVVAGDPKVFARNREVIIVPGRDPAGIESFRDLSKPGVKLVLAQDGVPAAAYAMDILAKADARYGGGFEKKVTSNLVSREADVRMAVNRVALGEADATFGYSSDVTPDIKDRVKVVEIPEELNVVATYPIAALKGSRNLELARRWIELVLSDEGQRVLRKWAFQSAV
jgi:molybdate transport system substrate-binding protein